MSTGRADTVGIYGIGADGSDLHPIFETQRGVQGGYQLPITSPDGTKVTYTNFENDPVTGTGNLVIHVRDLSTGADVAIPAPPDPANPREKMTQGYASFSPDGTLLAFQQFVGSQGYDLVVAPADGSGVGRTIGPTPVTDRPGAGSLPGIHARWVGRALGRHGTWSCPEAAGRRERAHDAAV